MWNITVFDELPSTQTLARERLDMGMTQHGDVIQALHQTAGRGRYGNRTWIDERGENLLLSIIFTDLPEYIVERSQFAMGLAIVRMLRGLLGETSPQIDPRDIRLKWTNDVLIVKRKIAGVLTEAAWSGNALRGVIAGIGININQRSFDTNMNHPATSLGIETGFLFPIEDIRERLLAEITISIEQYHSSKELMEDVRSELEWMRTAGRFDATDTNGTSENNLYYETISDDGSLWARNDNGDVRVFQNATIRLS